MKKNIRQKRKCKYCGLQVAEYYYKARFKGYKKTCDNHNGYNFRKGELNPAWKGGKIKDKDGYIRILAPHLHNKKGASRYMLEHRMIVESSIGRRLEKDEIVHHLNGIRSDNRIENLEIIKISFDGKTNHETWTYPKALQKRIKDLENQLEQLTKENAEG